MKNFEEVVKLLEEYKEKHGNCLVPQSYKTENGVNLGSIVNSIRTGARKTSETEKETLNKIGFVWKDPRYISFEEVVKLLEEYKEKHGDCLVPQSYITENEVNLGSIVSSIRKGDRKTSETEKETLNKIGFVWKDPRYISFEEVVKLLEEYKEKHGDCLVPRSYITENEVNLGSIVSSIRTGNRKTSEGEKETLNKIGFVWKDPRYISFEEVVKLLEEYKEKHGDCLVPQSYITENDVPLGKIVKNIRTGARKTSETEKETLNKIGFVWKVSRYISFEEVVKLLEEYKEKHGDCLVPQSYITENDVPLGSIVNSIRKGARKTSETEKETLNKIGFVWKDPRYISFEEVVKLLEEYKEKHGDCLVPQSYKTENGVNLGSIVSSIRTGNRKTSEGEKEILNKIGFVWRVFKKG